jgi:DNA gyrase/topoisomerase IV subunit B
MSNDSYDENSMISLGYPDNVRLKPSMYVGALGSDGLMTILREVGDNVLDECMSGHASTLDVFLRDKEVTILDDGRGIPYGKTAVTNQGDNSITQVPTLRAAFGVLHTSGKYNDVAYKISRGVHGLGVKASNALSLSLRATTFSSGHWRTVLFKKGKLIDDVAVCEAPKHPVTKKPLTKGTIVTYTPDLSIFGEGSKLSKADLFHWAKIAAYFTPNSKLNLHSVGKDGEVSSRTFHYPRGPVQYAEDRVVELRKQSEFGAISDVVFQSESRLHDCVLQFTSYDGCDLQGFTNGLKNIEGGFHVNSTLNALKDSLQSYLGKKQSFTLTELKDGLVGLINVKLSGAQFDSQTKEKLVDPRAAEPLKALLLEEFETFFKKNKKLAESICERASRLKDLKSKFVASKQMLTALKKISKKGLPAKAATAPKCKAEERELFLLEGDSAAGGMRFARNEAYQEFLPLKGKVLNVWKTKKQEITSEEILNIFAMIGLDPRNEDPLSKLRVGKIILMPDSDADGPLIGATRIKMANGTNRTMSSLVKDWDLHKEPFDVLSVDAKGEVYPTKAVLPTRVGTTRSLVKVTFSDGSSVKCTPNHVWPIASSPGDRHVVRVENNIQYLAAYHLKKGDTVFNDSREQVITVSSVEQKHLLKAAPIYCMSVPTHGNFLIEGRHKIGIATGNSHIATLLCAVLQKFIPGVFDREMVYVTRVPEYYSIVNKVLYYGDSMDQVKAALAKDKVKGDIQHLKGYGECPSDLLRVFACDPNTRLLAKIGPSVDDKFDLLMSSDTSSRKLLLGI